MSGERGKIKNHEASLQVKDYSGIKYRGGITPTDIDGFIEINNEAFIFIELKHRDRPLPYGQRLALERLCDNLSKPSIVLVCSHSTPLDQEIDAASVIVKEVRWAGKWIQRHPEPLKSVIDSFLVWCGLEEWILK
jgi:hypothetical protein